MVEELVNAYRDTDALAHGNDLDSVHLLPACLREQMFTAGEYDGMSERYGENDL